jgi:glucuronokinase
MYPSARLEIKASKADTPVFESLDELYSQTRWRGYYGGIRIIQAMIVRLIEYCREQGLELPNRNFTIEYESTIPLRLGMGGSSAIITAAFRALCQYYELDIPKPVQARLILEAETKEIGVPAGPQDRVVQVYEGLVYMDFRRDLMESRGYGDYELLDAALLPDVYLAYRTNLSEGTEVFHNNVRERWRQGDAQVLNAMAEWASYAERGRAALLAGDYSEFGRLIDANFDLRAQIYRIDEGNLEMIRLAREAGCTANFAGSGGAIVGTFNGADMFEQLERSLARAGVAVIRPRTTSANAERRSVALSR